MPGPTATAAAPSIQVPIEGTANFSQMFEEMQRMGTSWGKEMRKIEKKADKSTEGMTKDFKKFWWKAHTAQKEYGRLYDKTLKEEKVQVQDLKKKWGDLTVEIADATAEIKRLGDHKMKLDPKVDMAEIDKLDLDIENIQRKLEGLGRKQVDIKTKVRSVHEGSKEIKEKLHVDEDDLQDAAERAGDMIASPLKMVFSKDLPGIIKGSGKLLSAVLTKSGGGIGKLSAMAKDKAASMSPGKGADAMKAMGAALGQISSLLKTVGPMLSMASGLIVGMVQLFIEADAAAKDFSKEIMSTAGSAEFLSKNMGSTRVAGEDLRSTLQDMYQQATSWETVKWGISKEQFSQTMNAIEAEGVGLERLKSNFASVGDAAKESGSHIKDFAGLVIMSTAYSKAFGVSLQEIGQFGGEMMSEMGASADTVQREFQTIMKGAEDAGIASNKFFSIIRGVSADLNLYNSRLDETVHMLSLLGKVLSPKSAQQFLSATMNAVKGMGRAQRIQLGIMTGAKGGKVVDRDIKRSTESLAQTIADAIGGSADDYKDAIEKGGEDFQKILANPKMSDEQKGTIREAQLQVQLKKKMRAGGQVGTGIAMGEMGAGGQLDVITQALKKFNGQQSIANGISSAAEQFMAENLGVSIEQLNQMAKVEIALNDQKSVLKNNLKDEKTRLKLEKAGIKLGKLTGNAQKDAVTLAQDAAAVDAAGYDEIMDTMDDGAKATLNNAKKQRDFQAETADATVSVSTYLQLLSDFLMGAFYNAIMKMKAGIMKMSFSSESDEEKQLEALERIAVQTKNANLLKAIKESGGHLSEVKRLMNKQLDDLKAKLAAAKPEDKEGIQKQIDDLSKSLEKPLKAVEKAQQQVVAAEKERETGKTAGAVAGTAALAPILGPLAPIIGGAVGKALGPTLAPLVKGAAAWLGFGADTTPGLNAPAPAGPAPGTESLTVMPDVGGPVPVQLAPSSIAAMGATPVAAPAAAAAAPKAPGLDLSMALPDAATAEAGDKAAIANEQRGATPHSLYTHDTHLEKLFGNSMGKDEDAQEESADQGSTLSDIWKALRVKGIKIDKPFLENNVKGVFKDAVYDAAGEALEDYFLMTQNADAVVKYLKSGGKGAGKLLGKGGGKSADEILKPLEPHAAGGLVTGIGPNGLAQISPAPGEGLASIGKGERIGPAGGGGGGKQVIELHLKGDLGRIIDVRAQNVVSTHETMKTRR